MSQHVDWSDAEWTGGPASTRWAVGVVALDAHGRFLAQSVLLVRATSWRRAFLYADRDVRASYPAAATLRFVACPIDEAGAAKPPRPFRGPKMVVEVGP